MMDAAKAAEAVITSQGQSTPSTASAPIGEVETNEGEQDGRASPAPSATAPGTIDVNSLTPQTFLVRPTRPEANRNRGRNAFNRRRKPQGPNQSGQNQQRQGQQPADEQEEEEEEEDEFDEEMVEEMEHLQLCLEEAWFLSAALGVLRIYDPDTVGLPPTFCSITTLRLSLTPAILDPRRRTPTLPDYSASRSQSAVPTNDASAGPSPRRSIPGFLRMLSSLPLTRVDDEDGNKVQCRLAALSPRSSLRALVRCVSLFGPLRRRNG